MGKNQHFIPQFYQKYWKTEEGSNVWMLDKIHNNIRNKAIKSNCSSDYLYEGDLSEPDNAFEYWYGVFESDISPLYARFINSRFCLNYIDKDTKKVIARLVANISARHEKNVYMNIKNNILASKFTMGIDNQVVDRRVIQNMVAMTEGGVMDEGTSELYEKLMCLDLQVLVSNKPSIVYGDCCIKQMFDTNYYFPLCPYMLAVFSSNGCDGLIKRITQEEYNQYIDILINSELVNRIFASNREVLDAIKRYMEIL